MPLDSAPCARLEHYVEMGDRAIEPILVGRRDLLAKVGATAAVVARGEQLNGQTLCFPGPPGIGKTELLRMLTNWSASRGDILASISKRRI